MKKTNIITPVELARQRGQTLDWIYRQIRVGKIRAIKRGRQWVIPTPAVKREAEIATQA
jgi:excisionase family DNA binding protein